MGLRYQSILKFLGEPFDCLDIKNVDPKKMIRDHDRFIIATPTETHLGWVKAIDGVGMPILCEKPLSKSLKEVDEILNCKSPLTMTMQYTECIKSVGSGPTKYNYYNHGKDGLKWDCFQAIALAEGDITLREDSPVWSCMINGEILRRGDMDLAYVTYLNSWLKGKNTISRSQLIKWHQKVEKYEG